MAVIDAQAALPADEGEVSAEFKQEVFQALDQGGFELAFGVLVLEFEELQNIGVLDRLFWCAQVLGPGDGTLGQHGSLVPRQRHAFVELAVDLPIKLANAPAPTQGFSFVELSCQVLSD